MAWESKSTPGDKLSPTKPHLLPFPKCFHKLELKHSNMCAFGGGALSPKHHTCPEPTLESNPKSCPLISTCMRWHACIYEHVYAREETHTHTVITFKSQFLGLCYGSLNSHQGGLGDDVNNQLGVVPLVLTVTSFKSQ